MPQRSDAEKAARIGVLGTIGAAVIAGIVALFTSRGPAANPVTAGDPPPSSTASPSWRLVGTWRGQVTEAGQTYGLVWHVRPNGTMTYVLNGHFGSTSYEGHWQFSKGLLLEATDQGSNAKCSVEWVGEDEIVLTVVDNGVPAQAGSKRRHTRL